MKNETKRSEPYQRIGTIGRFKPLHLGGKLMLEALGEHADLVKIGIGSCNKYNARNPFTLEETQEMIDAALSPQYSNYAFIPVPDFAHLPEYADGQRWKQEVISLFGELDAFATGNPYITELLQDTYRVVHPNLLIPQEKWIRLRSSQIRIEMALGKETWKSHVPAEIANYLENHHLVERFRREFGDELLLHLNEGADYTKIETNEEEYRHTRET